jgi:serine phosphatase RsbU (regulator of sigma subunit)
MKRFYAIAFTIACSFLFTEANAQVLSSNKKAMVDSLQSVIDSPDTHDTVRWSCQHRISKLYLRNDPEKAIRLDESTLAEVDRVLQSKSFESNVPSVKRAWNSAVRSLGTSYYEIDQHYKAIGLYEKGLGRLGAEERKDYAWMHNRKAFSQSDVGDYAGAIESYRTSLDIFLQHEDSAAYSAVLINISEIYAMSGQYDEAVEHLHQSLAIKEAIGHEVGIANCHVRLGTAYANLDKVEEAQTHYELGLEMWNSLCENAPNNRRYRHFQSNGYTRAGNSYMKLGKEKQEQAYHFFNQAQAIGQKYGYFSTVVDAMNSKANIFLGNGKTDSTDHYLALAMRLIEEKALGNDLKIRALQTFYESKKLQGENTEALAFYKEKELLQDSLNRQKSLDDFVNHELKLKYEQEKALQGVENAKLLAHEEEERATQRLIRNCVIAALALVILFLALLFNRLSVARKQSLASAELKKEIEESHATLAERHKEIQDSINYAKHIQQAVMPAPQAMKDVLGDMFLLYEPKEVVAGDFFWMETPEENAEVVYFAAADCTRHGVPGAMMSLVCSNALTKALMEENIRDTGKLLDRTKVLVERQFAKSGEEISDGMDISLCAFKMETREMQWSGANNPLWIIRTTDSNVEQIAAQFPAGALVDIENGVAIIEIKADRQSIVGSQETSAFSTHHLTLNPNDSVYMFTDGIQDQFGGSKGKKFSVKQFRALLTENAGLSMTEQEQMIRAFFHEWKGDLEQVDDICIIGVRVE